MQKTEWNKGKRKKSLLKLNYKKPQIYMYNVCQRNKKNLKTSFKHIIILSCMKRKVDLFEILVLVKWIDIFVVKAFYRLHYKATINML